MVGFYRWWITSAKSGECVDEGLQALVDRIIEVSATFAYNLFYPLIYRDSLSLILALLSLQPRHQRGCSGSIPEDASSTRGSSPTTLTAGASDDANISICTVCSHCFFLLLRNMELHTFRASFPDIKYCLQGRQTLSSSW